MFSKLFSGLTRRRDATQLNSPVDPPVSPIPAETAADPIPATGPIAEGTATPDPVLVHREVLDSALGICGIEFMIRGELRNRIATKRATLRRFIDSMLIDQLGSLRYKPDPRRPSWIQLGEASLLRLGTGKLPTHCCVLLQTEEYGTAASADIRDLVGALRDAGHEVWLDDALATPWFESLATTASGAILRMAARTPFEAGELLKSTRERYPQLPLGAWDLTTPDDCELARRLDCCRFSGGFVTHREDWSGNTLSPQAMTVATLINQVREDVNFRAVANALKRDMALSYRMLRYVNVASHGLAKPVSSIEQGLVILGQEQLDRWLTLLLLAGGALNNAAITEIALTRARFLELAGAQRLPPEQCERLFILGLFSMLDVALKVPLATAIRPLNLAMPMAVALLSRGGPLGPYLALADACENGTAEEICRHALALGLTTSKVSARQMEAVAWVADITAQADPNEAHHAYKR